MLKLIAISIGVMWIISIIGVVYEIWRAPLLDDDFKQIKPTKKLRDLFK